MGDSKKGPATRGNLQRSRSNFLTKTATDNAAQLDRRYSTPEEQQTSRVPQHSGFSGNAYEPLSNASEPPPHRHELTKRTFDGLNGNNNAPTPTRRSSSGRRRSSRNLLGESSLTTQMYKETRSKSQDVSLCAPRIGSMPRPVGGHEKLGTFSGVFVPTTLNVLSILMFLRFGFILGQSGVLGMLGKSLIRAIPV